MGSTLVIALGGIVGLRCLCLRRAAEDALTYRLYNVRHAKRLFLSAKSLIVRQIWLSLTFLLPSQTYLKL